MRSAKCSLIAEDHDTRTRYRVHLGEPRRRGTLAFSMLALICLLFGSPIAKASQPFAEPEEAIRFFIGCVTDADYDRALTACAIEEIASGFDYEAMITWLRAMLPTTQYLPSEYGLFAVRNRHAVEYSILQQLSWMALSVVLPPEYEGFLEMYTLTDSSIVFDDVVGDMDPRRFLELEIVRIGSSPLLGTDQNVQYLVRQAEIYGASSATSRSVLYQVDAEYFVGGFQLLQYSDGWLIASLSDPLTGQPTYGVLIRVSGPEEFEEMLAP